MRLRPWGAISTALILAIPLIAPGQDPSGILKITRPDSPRAESASKARPSFGPGTARRADNLEPSRQTPRQNRSHRGLQPNAPGNPRWTGGRIAPAAITLQSFGSGGGDIEELEPNDPVAQSVGLPVNVIGKIRVNADVDFFAFRALADQQITIEAFAARIQGSELFADIALFDGSGELIERAIGGADEDPVIRYTPGRDQILIAGIADADDVGGRFADYLLNITRGIDVEEIEPNGTTARSLPDLPVTIFGSIAGTGDVDFYSFFGAAGQTLIVDVDAEVVGSGLDPEINLLDPSSGVQYFYNDQRDGDDPRFNIMLPYTGQYFVGIDAFEQRSQGFYRMNLSLVPGDDAPLITGITKLAKKLIEVRGAGITVGSVVEVNGILRQTTVVDSGTLRAKVKIRSGDVVTISNSPDARRSNPLIF